MFTFGPDFDDATIKRIIQAVQTGAEAEMRLQRKGDFIHHPLIQTMKYDPRIGEVTIYQP